MSAAKEELQQAREALAAIAHYQGGEPSEPWRITVETAQRIYGWVRQVAAERDAALARAEKAEAELGAALDAVARLRDLGDGNGIRLETSDEEAQR